MTPSPDSNAQDFLVRKQDLHQYRFADSTVDEADLQAGQALLRVDKFAFTSNNITYALVGEMMSYWDFFPAPEGWGRIPVWGFADVIRSGHEDIARGERLYGYFPLSTHLIVQPAKVKQTGFVDGSAHRQKLHQIYNHYFRVGGGSLHDPDTEDLQALLRPLFTTSFLIDDFLAESDFFGADAVILSSASSKTAFGTAFLLHSNRGQRSEYEVIGLTSPGNVRFVEQLGCYDRVVTYDAIDTLDAEMPVVFVDMAGNRQVKSDVHFRFRDNLKYSCPVGVTHWDRASAVKDDLPGAEPVPFFAPAQRQKRVAEWGAGEFQERFAGAWGMFLVSVRDWIEPIEGRGRAAVERVFLDVLAGRSRPDQGHILSLWD